MIRKAGQCEASQPASTGKRPSHRRSTYQKVLDARKQPIRGLWVRNGRYYAQLTFEDPATARKQTRRVPLLGEDKKPVETVAQAKEALERLKVKRADNDLPVLQRTPKFRDYVDSYFEFCRQVKDAKRPRTLETERGHLNAWMEHLGDIRLNQINRAMINAFIAKRQGEGRSGRTVNLAVVVLRNVLKRAIDDGWIKTLPTENLRPLKCLGA